ncbi:MAG: cytochrome C [Campylobacterales bacterium]|nr:cytochrome C [Campylobacterales bacterium]
MNKIAKIALSATIILGMGAVSLSADPAKGQKLYLKKLKAACNMTGAAMAGKHTQDEWKKLKEGGKIATELKTVCAGLKDDAVKDEYLEDYYDFFHEFGSDSGNVPSC